MKFRIQPPCKRGLNGLNMAQIFKSERCSHENIVERDYLNQMRDLVLRVTSGLDCTVFLFGSRARGVHRRSSDIDIGFSGLSDQLFTKIRDHLLI